MGFPPTPEQADAIRSEADLLIVKAYAGTGKTATAVQYAEARPSERILYIVFNKSAQLEGKERMPGNVDVKTTHGLAFGPVGAQYKHKLSGGIRPPEVMRALGVTSLDGGSAHYAAKLVVDTLTNFLCSPDSEVQHAHVPPDGRDSAQTLVGYADAAWQRMQDPADESVPMVHDGYLKLYQLSEPNLGRRYDRIILDEAQDTNPVVESIVKQQVANGMPVTLLGDPHQQIYAWRNAVNAMEAFDADEVCHLTESFRFGPQIAGLATEVLQNLAGEERPLIGRGKGGHVAVNKPYKDGFQHTVLHRTFVGTFESAVDAVKRDKTIAWVGGRSNYNLDQIRDMHYFRRGEVGRMQDPRPVRDYGNWANYRAKAEETGDPEMKIMVRIQEEYGDDIPKYLDLIEQKSLEGTEAEKAAEITLSTVHRAKGLEWDYVRIHDDMPDLHDPKWSRDRASREQWSEEVRLAYVAITRAQKALSLPLLLREGIQQAPDWVQKSREREARVAAKKRGADPRWQAAFG